MYRYLFGPVPSRRLGISLGIDLVPMKTCSLNCIYCECGRTSKLTVSRREYVPLAAVKAELDHYFSHHPPPEIFTFSGSGEPTLHAAIGELIAFIRQRQSAVPVAVLTNGTLLWDPQVREELAPADLVMPSLDAATAAVFKKLNRPHAQLNLDRIVDGLVCFRKEFKGRVWLEVFIVPGLNDTEPELAALKQAIEKIAPNRTQINTLDRPGTVARVRAATEEELKRILEFWQLPNCSIIAKAACRKESVAYRQDIETAVLETIARRPCTTEDLASILGLHPTEISKYLDALETDRTIRSVRQARGVFFMIK